jgi:hypothetical protein
MGSAETFNNKDSFGPGPEKLCLSPKKQDEILLESINDKISNIECSFNGGNLKESNIYDITPTPDRCFETKGERDSDDLMVNELSPPNKLCKPLD